MRKILLAASALAIANPVSAALTVHTSAFLATQTKFNGFEGIGSTNSFAGPYTEDGITAQYIGVGVIWTTSQAYEGNYSWYPNGGGTGFTRLTFATANAIQFAAGSGWGSPPINLNYEVLLGGVSIGTGSISGLSTYTGFGIYGFSGAQFDEVRLQGNGSTSFDPTAYEAGAYDAIAIGTAGVVPEPETWALMLAGFGLLGFAMRRQKATTRIAYA